MAAMLVVWWRNHYRLNLMDVWCNQEAVKSWAKIQRYKLQRRWNCIPIQQLQHVNQYNIPVVQQILKHIPIPDSFFCWWMCVETQNFCSFKKKSKEMKMKRVEIGKELSIHHKYEEKKQQQTIGDNKIDWIFRVIKTKQCNLHKT